MKKTIIASIAAAICLGFVFSLWLPQSAADARYVIAEAHAPGIHPVTNDNLVLLTAMLTERHRGLVISASSDVEGYSIHVQSRRGHSVDAKLVWTIADEAWQYLSDKCGHPQSGGILSIRESMIRIE